MSDLPSRDFFNGNDITMSGDRQLIDEAVSVLDAYAEGRLVDREAIDWEAAGRQWVATIPYDQQYEWDDPQSVEIVANILDAAIGGSDEK